MDYAVTASAPRQGNYYPITSVNNAPQCLDIHEVSGVWTLGLYGCLGTDTQSWSLQADQTIRSKYDSSYCLSGSSSPSPTGEYRVTFTRCSAAKEQKWSVSNFAIKHIASGRCAEASKQILDASDGFSFQGLTLVTCDAQNDYARWVFGPNGSALDAWKKFTANYRPSVAQRCQFDVIVEGYDASNKGGKRIMDWYQSSARLTQFIQGAVQENCAQMFADGKDVPFIRALTIKFNPTTHGAANTESPGGLRRVNLNCDYLATVDESDLPFGFRMDSLFHHELTHALDNTPDKPSGIKEGLANLISYRTGFVSDLQKVKGGDWTDGYSTTSFFLDWLDVSYNPQPLGMRFSDQMQKAGRQAMAATTYDKQWLTKFVQAQTGKTLDQLWTLYQATFDGK